MHALQSSKSQSCSWWWDPYWSTSALCFLFAHPHNRDNTLPPKCGVVQLIASSGKGLSKFVPNEALCLWCVSCPIASSPKTRIVVFSLSWNNEHLTQHILKQSYLTWTFRDRAGRAGFRQKNGYGYWKNVLVSVRFSQVAWHKWYIFYLCVEQFIFIIYTVHVHHHC